MTRGEMLKIEDRIYEAIRSKWGYGDEADEMVDGLGEAFDAWLDAKYDVKVKVKIEE